MPSSATWPVPHELLRPCNMIICGALHSVFHRPFKSSMHRNCFPSMNFLTGPPHAQSFCTSCHGQGINMFRHGIEVVAARKAPSHPEDPLAQAVRCDQR